MCPAKPGVARRKFTTHLAKIERRKAKLRTPEGRNANNLAVTKWKVQAKELYGADPRKNLNARAKWILAKHEKET